MPEIVIDSVVLQSANAELREVPRAGRKITRRLELLQAVRAGEHIVLYSNRLMQEYLRRIRPPRNDYIRAFFELITVHQRAIYNWHSPWKGDRGRARNCRYPAHDDHVLRTAIRGHTTIILTEEAAMLNSGECIYRVFDVRIQDV